MIQAAKLTHAGRQDFLEAHFFLLVELGPRRPGLHTMRFFYTAASGFVLPALF